MVLVIHYGRSTVLWPLDEERSYKIVGAHIILSNETDTIPVPFHAYSLVSNLDACIYRTFVQPMMQGGIR